MQDRVIGLADKALNVLEQTLEQGDRDSARVAAARLVLDRLLPTCHAEEERTPAGPTRVTVVSESDIRRLSDMQREAERARNVLTRDEAIEILQARRRRANP
jgi:hypothetical protein